MMKGLLEEAEVKETISEVIECLVGLLRQFDLRIYGEQIQNPGIQQQTTNSRITGYLNKRTIVSQDPDLTITSELEIEQIMAGLKSIVYECLLIEGHY